MREFTEEENRIWRESQPKKMVVAKVVIQSDQGHVLLVKPDYKKTWQFPGGFAEIGESPLQAAVREVKEELGLDIDETDLLLKGLIYKQDEELLVVVYETQTLISEETVFTLQADEITGYQFATFSNASPLLSDYYSDFWQQNYL